MAEEEVQLQKEIMEREMEEALLALNNPEEPEGTIETNYQDNLSELNEFPDDNPEGQGQKELEPIV